MEKFQRSQTSKKCALEESRLDKIDRKGKRSIGREIFFSHGLMVQRRKKSLRRPLPLK